MARQPAPGSLQIDTSGMDTGSVLPPQVNKTHL